MNGRRVTTCWLIAALLIGAVLTGCATQPRTSDQTCGSLPPSFTPPITCPLVDKSTKPLAANGAGVYDIPREDHE